MGFFFPPSWRVVYFVAVNKAAVLTEPPGRGQELGHLPPGSQLLVAHVGRDGGCKTGCEGTLCPGASPAVGEGRVSFGRAPGCKPEERWPSGG